MSEQINDKKRKFDDTNTTNTTNTTTNTSNNTSTTTKQIDLITTIKPKLVSLESLNMFHNGDPRFFIQVQCISKEPLMIFKKKRNGEDFKVFKCQLIDASQKQITLEAFEALAESLLESIKLYEFYTLSNLNLEKTISFDKRWNNHDFKIKCKTTESPLIKSCTKRFNLEYTKIKDIPLIYSEYCELVKQQEIQKEQETKDDDRDDDERSPIEPPSINLFGLVTFHSECKRFKSKKNDKEYVISNLTICDESNYKINIDIWGETVQYKIGETIFLNKASIKLNNLNNVTLTGGKITIINESNKSGFEHDLSYQNFLLWSQNINHTEFHINLSFESLNKNKEINTNYEFDYSTNYKRISIQELLDLQHQAKEIMDEARRNDIINPSNPFIINNNNKPINQKFEIPEIVLNHLPKGTFVLLAQIHNIIPYQKTVAERSFIFPTCPQHDLKVSLHEKFGMDGKLICNKCNKTYEYNNLNYSYGFSVDLIDKTNILSLVTIYDVDAIYTNNANETFKKAIEIYKNNNPTDNNMNDIGVKYKSEEYFKLNQIIGNNVQNYIKDKFTFFLFTVKIYPDQMEGITFRIIKTSIPSYEKEIEILTTQLNEF